MKIKTCYYYLYQDKILCPTKVEDLPEGSQFVEGELLDADGNMVSIFLSVVIDGVDTMTGIKIQRSERNVLNGNLQSQGKHKIVRVRNIKRN